MEGNGNEFNISCLDDSEQRKQIAKYSVNTQSQCIFSTLIMNNQNWHFWLMNFYWNIFDIQYYVGSRYLELKFLKIPFTIAPKNEIPNYKPNKICTYLYPEDYETVWEKIK